MRRTIVLAALLALTLGGSVPRAVAQVDIVPVTDVRQRGHVTVNAGTMVLTSPEKWSGASLGGTVLYNLHPKLSVFGGYDHGFPINDVDESLNLWRAVGSLRVHPNALVGFGYAWFDKHTDGALAQLVVTKQVLPRTGVGAVYAHIFSSGTLEDFEYLRVYVNYHLIGKE
jgi:hypothetical protein